MHSSAIAIQVIGSKHRYLLPFDLFLIEAFLCETGVIEIGIAVHPVVTLGARFPLRRDPANSFFRWVGWLRSEEFWWRHCDQPIPVRRPLLAAARLSEVPGLHPSLEFKIERRSGDFEP